MNSPRVAIIILNLELIVMNTLACLASLKHLDYEEKSVIVIDNGSTDNSVMAISATIPKPT